MPRRRLRHIRRPLAALVALVAALAIGYGVRAANHAGSSSKTPARHSVPSTGAPSATSSP